MKTAIVCDFLTKFGGAQRVVLALHEIYPEAPIYCLAYDEKGTKGKFKSCRIIESSLGKYPAFIKRKTKLFLPLLPKKIEEFTFENFDMVISSSDSYAHGIITKPSTFHLCYCHTPMRYVWDWYHEYLEENSLSRGLSSLFIRNILHKIRIWDRVAAYRVDRWIANSANVQMRIQKYYKADSTIIYPPIETEKIKPNSEEPEDYFLVVSRLEPYKRIDLAIEACNKLQKKLFIIGEGSDLKRLKHIAGDTIQFLGWLPDKKLYSHLSETKALIFPGEEDFGMTPIEAMAAGRPVIAYKKGGVNESVIDGKTGFLFSHPTVESLAEAILQFEKSARDINPDDCVKTAQKFSKEVFQTKIKNFAESSYQEYLNTLIK